MSEAARKDVVRRLALARRSQIDPQERAIRGSAIVERLLGLPEMSGTEPVLAFVSIRSEVPTDILLRALLDAGRPLLLPYVDDDGGLGTAPVGSLEELAPGYRGIPEPRAHLRVAGGAPGVVIVPGVAFDARGARLGYGGGFYDRMLAGLPGVTRVGICFEAQLVEEIPTEEHDQLVDVVVTEERELRPV